MRGKLTGKPYIWWQKPWFPVDFPLNQSIKTSNQLIFAERFSKFLPGRKTARSSHGLCGAGRWWHLCRHMRAGLHVPRTVVIEPFFGWRKERELIWIHHDLWGFYGEHRGNMRIWRGSKKAFDVDKNVDLNTPSLDLTTKNGDFINKHDGIVGIWWDNDEFNMELRTRRRD